uniref:sperm-specific antigen 2 isoform X2 n=1 Tax=Monopterus albus TaxID=43700 RepID=UPI0009B3701A|nr:sperm-specific antigen 2 isoform X2 [Monopterus albus]
MESGALGIDTSAAPDPGAHSDCGKAFLRRQAWAHSKDSLWQESEQEQNGPQEPDQGQRDEDAQRTSEEPGQVPNKITSWLIECRTPLVASLDDQSAPPSKGALKNGCSFEDDLSLGAEANHLQSTNNKTQPCLTLAAQAKRSHFKENGRSMNSTGSGKSSTVSSVSELLDLYEEDPEEILLNLGFGQEEPDLTSRVPSRFLNSSSSAQGIDIKVYLGAQMQRMEVENPSYALTSRFRQIEVLTTVANEFFQLYSQVSGQPVKCINSKDQQGGGGGGEGGDDFAPPPLKRSSSALNAAKLFKRTITRHNLLAAPAATQSAEAHTPNQHKQLNGHTPSDHAHTNGHAHTGPEQDGSSTDPEHQGETVGQKHVRRRDSPLATVTEETNGDGEMHRLTDNSPEQTSTGPTTNGEPESAELQSTNQKTEERTHMVRKEEEKEKNLTSVAEKAPLPLAPPQLAQLRSENADSFDMEEIQSNEDEALPSGNRANDLLRSVSQQSDSSGFAEEPSADTSSCLKVQESSDSCDSETTVTSHPSQDATTPLAMDQPAFDLPDGREEETRPEDAVEADGKSSSREEDKYDGSLEQVPHYMPHHLPINRPTEAQQDESQGEEQVEPEPEPEQEITHSMSASEQEPQQNQADIAPHTEPPTKGVVPEDQAQENNASMDDSSSLCSSPSSVVLSALNRAKQNHLSLVGQQFDPQPNDAPQTPERERGRCGIRMQRSSSLPSTLLSPSRVVSSVKIQFGRGQASCTQPRYSFKYTQEAGKDNEEQEQEKKEGPTNCLSTLYIGPAPTSGSTHQANRLPSEAPIPHYLMRSTRSLHSSSPPPDWPPRGSDRSWSIQSVPDLSSSHKQTSHFQQNIAINQNKQNWGSGQMVFPHPHPHPNPNSNPAAQYPSPNPSPSINLNPYPFSLNPPPQYPSAVHPYTSLPNLHHPQSPFLNNHSSLTSLHQPTAPTVPQHGSLSDLHQPSNSSAPHHISPGNLHSESHMMHYQGYNHLYSQYSPYYASPYGSHCASPYPVYHGYNMSQPLAFPHPITEYPLLAPEHSLHPGLAAPGFLPGLASAFNPSHSLHQGLIPPASALPGPTQSPSSTEMQLRRVLHDIRGTVRSLNQNRADTPDRFTEHRGALPSHQSLTEFQQKRRSLNLFRSQMMDLEMSIIRQQALAYKHLSPADRSELEHLQSLRSAVREELQELEQQLEDRLLELTHQMGLHRDSSVDSLCTASALRAMEPMSELLREQLFLRSELSCDHHEPLTEPSSRSSSPVRGGEEEDEEQRQGTYRASINIIPTLPPRPSAHTEEDEEQDEEKDGSEIGGGGAGEEQEGEGAAGEIRVENLQLLIREIRESVAQEVRREIYNELLAAASPQCSPLPTRRHPL